jgi:hypothetical protein
MLNEKFKQKTRKEEIRHQIKREKKKRRVTINYTGK